MTLDQERVPGMHRPSIYDPLLGGSNAASDAACNLFQDTSGSRTRERPAAPEQISTVAPPAFSKLPAPPDICTAACVSGSTSLTGRSTLLQVLVRQRHLLPYSLW